MKYLKKFAGIALALVMVMALAAPAFAMSTGGPVIEVKTHTFNMYQLLVGTPVEGAEDEIFQTSTIDWGAHLKGQESAFAEALKNSSFEALKDAFADLDLEKDGFDITSAAGAEEVAKRIDAARQNSTSEDAVGQAIAQAAQPLVKDHAGNARVEPGNYQRPTGYYLLEDTQADATKGEKTLGLLAHVDGTSVVSPKITRIPTVTKEVKSTEDGKEWVHATDYKVGDEIPFKITATLPESFDTAEDYHLFFFDNQNEHLNFNADSLKVSVIKYDNAGTPTTTPLVKDTHYGVFSGNDPQNEEDMTFTVRITDLKKEIPTDSPFYGLKKDDQIVIEYTSTLVGDAGDLTNGGLGYENEVELDFGGDTKPKDKTTVYTFKLDVNKVDGNKQVEVGEDDEGNPIMGYKPLAGAEFALYREATDADKENDSGVEVVYDLVDANGKKIAGEWVNVELKTMYDGQTEFNFEGLKQGNYVLVETEHPTGYNPIEPIYLTVKATYKAATDGDNKEVIDTLTVTETDSSWNAKENATTPGTDCTITMEVKNFQGVILPETGGIGTTIFYIVGGVLVVGAVVLLITKRRAGADEE